MNAEFRRLLAEFEKQAACFPDLSLSVFYVVDGEEPEPTGFTRPNHAIVLWQYLGPAASVRDRIREQGLIHTAFGVGGAKVSAFGVLQGDGTSLDLFKRMASRAGSLVPSAVATGLSMTITQGVPGLDEASKPVFASNPNPLAVWLNLVVTCVATFQPERFRGRTLAVDPFTASLAVFDHILCRRPAPVGPPATLFGERRFTVALSFPGEKRPYVDTVAHALEQEIGGVFYDRFFEAELAQPDLDLLLQRIYRYNSELVAVFLCADYERKEWCGVEWRAIRDLLKSRRPGAVMFLRFDDVEVRGVLSIDGYADLRGKPPEAAAQMIAKRYRCT